MILTIRKTKNNNNCNDDGNGLYCNGNKFDICDPFDFEIIVYLFIYTRIATAAAAAAIVHTSECAHRKVAYNNDKVVLPKRSRFHMVSRRAFGNISSCCVHPCVVVFKFFRLSKSRNERIPSE